MIRKVLFITLILVIAIVASGCSSTTTTNTTNPAPVQVNNTTIINNPAPVNNPNPQTYTVNIQNNAFNPSSVQIPAGSTVKWINLDPIQHEPKGNIFDSGPLNQNPQTYTINIQNNAFNPSSVQIAVGGTVKWVNMDSVKHEPKGRVFDSGPLEQNGTFEYTFKSAGTYNYQCAIHPSMLGTIKVV